MRRKVSILARSMILTFLLTLLLGSLVVHAEDEVKKPEINFTNYTVNIGDEDDVLQLKMENLGDKKPRWISYNVNVARVDQDGYVTPLRKGTAIISSGIGFPRKTCVVKVVDPSVKLNKSAATLYRSDKENTPGNTITLTAKVNGATKDAKQVVWSSSDTSVATVEKDKNTGKGIVTAVDGTNGKAGTAVITARVNGRTASCKVTVLESTISLNVDKMQLSTKGAGSSIKLVPTIVGLKKAVTWTSSNPQVATVKGGKVTGKKASDEPVTVTATANGVETTCTVTVVNEQISISEEKVLLYVTKNASGETTGETKELKTNAAKTDNITWTSDNVDVVTVEGQIKGKTQVAKITAVGEGTAVITATCNDKTDTCVVEVKNPSTSIKEKVVHLKTKGAANKYTLDYQVIGRNNKVTWKSSDTKVVSVSKGKLTGKKAGTATVTMTANGVTDKVQVIVQDYTPTIALNQKEYTLYTKGGGNSVALKATVNGANKKVQWKSNNASVAEVNAKGKVTAKGKGKALITATANGMTANCWVNVKEPMIILEKNALVIKPGQKVNLCDYASIEVIGAKQSVTYKSSNAKAATVNAKGLVTGKKAGEAEITIKANGVEEKCEVVVSGCETHTFDAPKTLREATCEENGLISKTCTVCGGKEQEVTPPLGHSFGKWTVVAWSTENAAGLERQVCTRCKEENTRIIPAKNKGDLAYGYKLEWEDDFNGAELDRSSWNVELHPKGWVNNELQEYVDSEKNIYVKDGNLVIQAIKDGDTYTSGRVNTKDNKDYQYGRFEARAKVPSGKGFLPAFWMMPTDENYYGQWPKCGEIDIMEVVGDKTNKSYSTLHFGNPHTEKQGSYEGEADFSEDFHVYACEWDPDEFRFYVDDKLFYTVNDWFTKKDGFPETAYPAPYDQPFYMILNLAVGGTWPGDPDETTAFGDNAQLVVDYVRVYQKDDYDTNVSKPGTDVQLRDPDKTGNYIINGDFAEVEDLSKSEDKQENWKLHLEKGGAATAENSDEVLNITQTAAGTENHSVQILQANLPIEKGCSYKLSYDAYADAERTMITNVTAPDRGYNRYLADTKVTLTTTSQNFEHTFEMTSDSDANGRVEFNLGNQNSTAAVHIDNVRLEKLGVVEEEEEIKGVLPDGNYVYNGSFNEGNLPGRLRLDYWDWKAAKGASVSVTDDAKRELKVVVPETVSALEDVAVYQKPIAITGGKAYKLSFNAYADQAKTIKTTIAGETFESALTTENKEYKYEFNTAEGLDGSELRFLLGAPGITYIDNVSIRRVGADTGLIVNGDFSSGMAEFEAYVDSNAGASATYTVDSLKENDAFSIDIESTGNANKDGGFDDWYIQLKQTNIKLEKDKWYKLDFKAKSTLDRQIKCALQRDGNKHNNDWTPYFEKSVIDLTGEYQNFSYTFMMKDDTDPEAVFSITMGSVGGKQITQKHTIVIDDITLVETEAQEIPPVVEGKEMIANGDFSEGEAHWENAVTPPAAAEVSFADGKATYEITNVGEEDYHIQLKHKEALTLEQGAEYAVSFKIKSTAARTVKYAFLDPINKYDWYGGQDLSLTANDEKKVEYTLKVSKATCDTINFVISMGKIAEENTPTSTIEIDDISVKKIGGTGGEEPVAPGTELIKNGNFSKGKEDWSDYIHKDGGAEATSTFADNKARYEITKAGEADWNVQLKQEGLNMEKGAYYKVNFKIGSSINRKVNLAIMGAKDAWCGGSTIELTANKLKSYSQIVTLNEKYVSGTVAFQISMGQLGDAKLAAHAIEISDISVTKVEAGTEADEVTETEVTIAPPGGSGDKPDDPVDPVEPGTELIKNGDFSKGKEDWTESGIYADGQGTESFEGGKAAYKITNVGTDDWHVQLKQTALTLEKGAKYKLSFKVKSTAARNVIYKLQDPDNGYADYGSETISLEADTEKTVEKEITVDKASSKSIIFVIAMGKTGDGDESLPEHTIEIDDVSLVKDDGAGDDPSDDPVEIDTELIKNGNFADGEANWWSSYIADNVAQATKKFTANKARYEIKKAGTADWNVQLKQTGLAMKKGTSYKVNVTMGSTIDRGVKFAIMGRDEDAEEGKKDVWFGGGDFKLKAGMKHTFSRIVKLEDKEILGDGTLAFQLSMGQLTGVADFNPHAIEIYSVSITEAADDTTADTETEEDVTIEPPAESGEDPDDPEKPDAENLIKNGNFLEVAEGGESAKYWTSEIGNRATVKFTKGESKEKPGKVAFDISDVGQDDWDVKFLYDEELTLEAGASYKVKFKIKSTETRIVKYSFMAPGYDYYGGEDLNLEANVEKSVDYKMDVTKATSDKITFSISMGQITEGDGDNKTNIDTPASTIEISDIKLIKVKDGTGTEVQSDLGTVPPTKKSGADTDDNSEAVVEEEEDDQDPEDQDDKSDDSADDKDANPADQGTSDEQAKGGDVETSDDQSGSGNAQASGN